MAKKPDDMVEAVGTIYNTLEPLDAGTRDRVLKSVASLLGMEHQPQHAGDHGPGPPSPTAPTTSQTTVIRGGGRPISLNEMILDKQPAGPPQYITLFAYYRERVEGKARFARADLREYFAKASEKPSQNFDRDFIKAVKLGWVHEEGDASYITTKGLEVVEVGFGGKALPRGRAVAGKRTKATKKKAKKTSKREPKRN